MKFPKNEAQVAALAQSVSAGLTNNLMTFPSPPVSGTSLATLLGTFNTARDAALSAAAVAESAVTQKNAVLDTLVDAMKKDLRYAEITVDDNDDDLKLLGWGGRKTPTPTPPPGQTLSLAVLAQGEGSIDLAWRKPLTGGMPSAFTVERRLRAGGAWEEVQTAVATAATLVNQERGKEFEFRVVALNKAGTGEPSNTVMVVL